MAEFQPPQILLREFLAMGCANQGIAATFDYPQLTREGEAQGGWDGWRLDGLMLLQFFLLQLFWRITMKHFCSSMMLYGDLNVLCFFCEFFKSVLAVIRERGISFIPIISRKKVSFLNSLLASQLYGSVVVSNVF